MFQLLSNDECGCITGSARPHYDRLLAEFLAISLHKIGANMIILQLGEYIITNLVFFHLATVEAVKAHLHACRACAPCSNSHMHCCTT